MGNVVSYIVNKVGNVVSYIVNKVGNVVSYVVNKVAFFPPYPSYDIEMDEKTGKQRLTNVPERSKGEVLMVETKSENIICTVYVKNPLASLTVLYSHGNATDIGQIFSHFTKLSDRLGVNVMGYDYTGYGMSKSKSKSKGTSGEKPTKPSEETTYEDIEAAYKCLVDNYGVKEEDIILLGQSIGSGPTLELAIRLPRLGAVILQSAFLSAIRTKIDMGITFPFDIYKNIEKIPLLNCPVLVIHGTDDGVVNVSHGYQLYDRCKLKQRYEPLWLEGGKHSFFESTEFFMHLKKFISFIEKSPRL